LGVTTRTSPDTTFDERALASLPEVAGFTGDLRTNAFHEFESLPTPSQETEEWRYTDLSEFALDFTPYTPGGRAENLDGVPSEILEAAGAIGERAGLQIQHDSDVMVTHLDPALKARGVIFTDLDAAAAEHPDLVERYLHDLVPTKRTRFTALHAAFRTGGTFLYVPRDTKVDLPLQTLTYVDVDGAVVFPHTLIVGEPGA
jgi:Fe-S cluster assembly protein SufD